MKIRTDFVTNSSSSSFIVCFARISDKEKAQSVIDRYNLQTYSAKEVQKEYSYWGNYIGNDFAAVYPDDVLKEYPNDNFIVIWDSNDAYYEESEYGFNTVYDYNFSCNEVIDELLKNDGFSNIMTDTGEGFDG